jgi:hypothetical protein
LQSPNDAPRTFTANFDLTAPQGVRFMEFVQSEFGTDDTGATRSAQATADAFADEVFAKVRRDALRYLRGAAAAAEPDLWFTRV